MDYNNIDFSFDALESKLLSDNQCGTEIDYDPDFLELETMVSPKAEQQYGDTIIPATPIDWSRALTKACELLGKSKDYRLCSIITRALTHKYGVRGTLKGIESIQALTDHFWQDSYPSIIIDGETDLFPRANAIAELNSISGLIGDLRYTDIALGAAGKISLGNIEKILNGRGDHESFSREQLLQILQDEADNQNSELLTIKQLFTQIVVLEKQLIQLFGNDLAPDLSQLKHLLAHVNMQNSNETAVFADEDDSISIASEQATNLFSQQKISTTIQSRADAIKLLDKVCDFLEQSDPANPAPLLIKRARNMIGQDFYTILSQLAPDAVAQAEHITGPQF